MKKKNWIRTNYLFYHEKIWLKNVPVSFVVSRAKRRQFEPHKKMPIYADFKV